MTRHTRTHPAPTLSRCPSVRPAVAGLAAVCVLALFAVTGVARPAVAEASPVTRAFVPIGQPQDDTARSPAPQADREGRPLPDRPVIVNNGQIIVVPSASPATGHPPVFAPVAVPPGRVVDGLPLACLERVALHRAVIQLMDAACLADAGVDVRTLPSRCAVAVQTRGPVSRGFDPACLGAAGYRLAGR